MDAQPPPAYAEKPPMPPRSTEQAPNLPPRPISGGSTLYNPGDYENRLANNNTLYPPPPQRLRPSISGEDINSPIHYTRDPHRLVAYLVPFPKPKLEKVPSDGIPDRFLIYTPPPPPLGKPKEGEKEGRVHKVQRKWEEEIREAKTSDAKTMSWQGIKGKVTRGVNWGMGQTKTSNLEFINRINANQPSKEELAKSPGEKDDSRTADAQEDQETSNATVKLEEMALIYPSSILKTPDELRVEFVQTMLRSKSKANRDSMIATGLLPVSFAIDTLATPVWPFGGLVEIDAVWAYASISGAKTSRSVTKRLASSSDPSKQDEKKLSLTFTPSARLAVLEKYLAARCHEREAKLFPYVSAAPTETEVLEAIGWSPSQTGGAERNWEDDAWEISEVKEDFKSVMTKGAREWSKWTRAFEKEPEKALKK